MLEQMCAELENKFMCRFKIKDVEGLIEIVCNDRSIEDNEEAMEEILKIGAKYLDDNRLWDIGVVYDYLGELPCKEVAKVFSQEKSMMTSCYTNITIKNYLKNLTIADNEFKMVSENKSSSRKSKIIQLKEKAIYKLDKLVTNIVEGNCKE